jgi:hypothetical protein
MLPSAPLVNRIDSPLNAPEPIRVRTGFPYEQHHHSFCGLQALHLIRFAFEHGMLLRVI